MTYYQIDDKIYYLDLNNIFALVTETPSSEKLVNTTITQYYNDSDKENDEEGVEVSGGKEVVESKSSLNDTMNNVRYDLVKNLLSGLLQNRYDSDGVPVGIKHLDEFSFAQGLCFNTLIQHNILLEVESDE